MLPGHGFVLQVSVCVADPTQSAPPWAGEGLVQERVRVFTPLPHDLVQAE